MKQLKDLTLLDKFLFDETMDHPEATFHPSRCVCLGSKWNCL